MLSKQMTVGAPHSVVLLEGVRHVVLMAVPEGGASLREQAEECLHAVRESLAKYSPPSTVLAQTVFLKDAGDRAACQDIFAAHFGPDLPVTTYVMQPPCNGAALGIETWAVAREPARIVRQLPHIVSVSYNDVTWTHCGGIVPETPARGVYERSLSAFTKMRSLVDKSSAGFDHTMRTWLYLGDIVGPEGETQRYKELNRARTDFYLDVPFGRAHRMKGLKHGMYPASTGIGMGTSDLAMSGLVMDTTRKDVFLLPLENPQQTPAYEYHARHSPQSPKFCRAMALSCGNYATIMISGTASITNAETRHDGDVVAQTHETLDNIAALISEQNLAGHGLPGLGTTLEGLAVVRVYVKNAADYPAVREAVLARLGEMPTIYAIGDVCRPDLLVEIEGIAFSRKADAAGPA